MAIEKLEKVVTIAARDTAFIGGDPALDFLNTVEDLGKTRERSAIGDWPGLRRWAGAAALFAPEELTALDRIAPGDRPEALEGLHALREAGYATLSALAAKIEPPAAWAELEARITAALARASLSRRGDAFGWAAKRGEPEWPVDAAALALERLLRSAELPRLRECGRCSWLFIDRGRGRGRRWCDMRACGNRAKAEAFRRR